MKSSVYIHIPFCSSRCSYCDFNTYAGLDDLILPYVRALCDEIEVVGQNLPEIYRGKIHTVYFGGGTPSLLHPRALRQILSSLKQSFGLGENPEICLEANPGTLSLDKLRGYADSGINRLSLGFQSANRNELELLGRNHSLQDVSQAVEFARLAGIRNLNLDLIYGLPNQTLKQWENTLKVALSYDVEHLSLYSLTIEEGTPLNEWIRLGRYPSPDADFAADCYELARDLLEASGYLHYEISNWAKRAGEKVFICHHNLQYWKTGEYFGFGAGAHGFVGGYRLVNVLHPASYIDRMAAYHLCIFPSSPATENLEKIENDVLMKDTVMLGLRLVAEGIDEQEFAQRFGMRLSEAFANEIARLIKKGLVEWVETDRRRLRLTRRGQLLGNQAFMEFV